MHRSIAIAATALAALLAVVVVLVSRDGNGTPIQQEGTTPTTGEPDTQATTTSILPPSATAQSTRPIQSPTSTVLPTHMAVPAEKLRQILAERLELPMNSVDVVHVEEVVWPDTCLGLPSPEMCAPGEPPGLRVVLRALAQDYTYHTAKIGLVRFAGPGDTPKRP